MTPPPAIRLAALLLFVLGATGCGGGGDRAPETSVGTSSVPSFAALDLTSRDVATGRPLAPEQMASSLGGQNISPELSWSDAPSSAQSFAVTVFDRDAGGGRGYWHWAVVDISASVTGLPSGAGASDGADLPSGSRQLPGSSGSAGYSGAAPPAGSGTHHYVVTLSALDVATLAIPPSSTAAEAASEIEQHTVARGEIVPTATG